MSASRRHSSWIAALALLALVWHALLPLAAAAVPPRTYATLCTGLGVRVVALDEDQAPVTHGAGDHCPLCRIAGGGDAPLPACAWQIDRAAAHAPAVPVTAGSSSVRCRWAPGSPRAPPVA
jgi:hypothetical protein